MGTGGTIAFFRFNISATGVAEQEKTLTYDITSKSFLSFRILLPSFPARRFDAAVAPGRSVGGSVCMYRCLFVRVCVCESQCLFAFVRLRFTCVETLRGERGLPPMLRRGKRLELAKYKRSSSGCRWVDCLLGPLIVLIKTTRRREKFQINFPFETAAGIPDPRRSHCVWMMPSA